MIDRPCSCDKCNKDPGVPWDSAQCWLCWLHHHNPAYRESWADPQVCGCKEAGFCERYGRPMHGRDREICQGTNVDLGEAAVWRQRWLAEKAQPQAEKCPFLGEEHRDKEGKAVTRECKACGDKKLQNLKVFSCNHPARAPDEVTVSDCQQCAYRPRPVGGEPLLLRNRLCPGDVLCMTAAVYSLHRAFPGKYRTAVETTCPSVWDFNPDVTPLTELTEPRTIEMHYPLIQHCNQRAVHQLQGYTDFLGESLGLKIPLATNRPLVYIAKQETVWMNQVHEAMGKPIPYWVVNAGFKKDFSAKSYPHFQNVIDRLQGRIFFVQIGALEHEHQPLRGVLNLLGKTDHRQLIRLVANARGALCGTTYLMHLAAALEKPSVVLAGGREPRQWNQYPIQEYISTIGEFDCCRTTACWRSRTVKLGDGADSDNSLCEQPVFTEPSSPRCMASISPDRVADAVVRFSGA